MPPHCDERQDDDQFDADDDVGDERGLQYHPRDKSKAELGVQVVQRWVLAALRKRQFFSLAELNGAILELVHKLNARPFRNSRMIGSLVAHQHLNLHEWPAIRPMHPGNCAPVSVLLH